MFETITRRWLKATLILLVLGVALAGGALAPDASATIQTGTISGRITNTAGTPLQNVSVQLYDAGAQQPDGYNAAYTGSMTDVNGDYSISGIQDGTYYVWISTTGAGTSPTGYPYADQWYGPTAGAPDSQTYSSAAPVTVSSGQTTSVDASLTSGAEITGTVTDLTTGKALTGGEVYAFNSSGDPAASGGSPLSSTGSYTIPGLTTGSYYLLVFGTGTNGEYENSSSTPVDDPSAWYGASGPADSPQTGSAVSASAGASTAATANFVLPTAARVQGSVSAGTNPEGDTEVMLYDSAGNPTDYTAESLDDPNENDDGTYTIYSVLPGAYKVMFEPGEPARTPAAEYRWPAPFTVDAARSGNLAFQYYDDVTTLSGAQTIDPTPASPAQNVNADLVAGGSISGTVTDASTGHPIPDATVDLLDASGDQLEQAVSSAEGTYTLDGIPSGGYYVGFSAEAPGSVAYQNQYYPNRQVLAAAAAISVTPGAAITAINAAMGPATTPGPVTTTTTTVPATPPAVTASSLSIVGTAQVGKSLVAVTSGWSGATFYSYTWSAGGTAISGASGPTLALTPGDDGKAITVTVTGSQSGYTWATKTSAPTSPVAAGTLKSVAPRISGTAKVGRTLTAASGTWTAGTRFTYQWYANARKIAGATKSTLKLTAAQSGKRITVRVTGRLTGYASMVRASASTAKVS